MLKPFQAKEIPDREIVGAFLVTNIKNELLFQSLAVVVERFASRYPKKIVIAKCRQACGKGLLEPNNVLKTLTSAYKVTAAGWDLYYES